MNILKILSCGTDPKPLAAVPGAIDALKKEGCGWMVQEQGGVYKVSTSFNVDTAVRRNQYAGHEDVVRSHRSVSSTVRGTDLLELLERSAKNRAALRQKAAKAFTEIVQKAKQDGITFSGRW